MADTRLNWIDHIERRTGIALPHAHFMALAPLDVWARMLLTPPQPVSPRYWLRLAAGLFTSSIGTGITLPERLALAPYLALRNRQRTEPIDMGPHAPVVVLGYFRTGTTHLHYLLSCDERFITPTWTQTTAPHGFWLSWAFLRLFLIPFLAQKRPQDDVTYGPQWPSEDDFALNNMALASSLPGRLVFPRSRADLDARFHFLEGLSATELTRWKRSFASFLWRVQAGHANRRLLLKTPSHTAHVPALLDMFGENNVKFIHISRGPEQVVRSNVAMLKRLSIYHLEDAPSDDVLEQRIVHEYANTERAYLAVRKALPPANLAELRYEDLRADPIGQLQSAYGQLGIEWTRSFEQRAGRYLHSVEGYQPASGHQDAPTRSELQFIDEAFGHSRPSIASAPLPESTRNAHDPRRTWISTVVTAIGVAIVLGLAWHGIVRLTLNRYDTLVWPVGALIGAIGLRFAPRGSNRFGGFLAALTLIVAMAVAIPNTRYAFYKRYDPTREHVSWGDLWDTTKHEWLTGISLFWIGMGMATAHRFGSRVQMHAPGQGRD